VLNFPSRNAKKMVYFVLKFIIVIMATFLFDEIIFGPIQSRRLGVSLGINLLPNDYKFCNFDCVYCECGYTLKDKYKKHPFHAREIVRAKLEDTLYNMQQKNTPPDVITFAGNGEPTLHPDFEAIIEDTISLRNQIFPKAKIAVLSNATMAHKESVKRALLRVDENILKLDSALDSTIAVVNRPPAGFTSAKLAEVFKSYEGRLVIQTMFLKGSHNGEIIDNTTDVEIKAWLNLLQDIQPRLVMIYTIARDTPGKDLERISPEKLKEIASKVERLGIKIQVSV